MEPPNDPKFNPYRAPVANADALDTVSDDARYIPRGRAVAADEGLKWITAAWQLFVAAPWMWIVMVVLYAISFMVLAFVPFFGTLLGYFLYVVLGAGWLVGAHAVARGEPLLLDHLFAGFKNKTAPLLVLGAIYAAGSLAILCLMLLFVAIGLGASGIMAAMSAGDISLIASIVGGSIITFLTALLIGAALLVPLLMALWFAPALVYFHNESPIDALKISFIACLKNWLPFLLYGILMLIVFVIASIPFMLGFLVAGPLAIISGYTSYRAVFTNAA
jgi:uncharacterized membrane protein